MQKELRKIIIFMIIMILLVVIITYHYGKVTYNHEKELTAPVYQFISKCDEEYIKKNNKHMADAIHTSVVTLAYNIFYNGKHKGVIEKDTSVFKRFQPELSPEAKKASDASRKLLLKNKMQKKLGNVCPDTVNTCMNE